MNILGLAFDDYDASAALLAGDTPVAAIQEERLSRIGRDPSLPRHAVDYCLGQAGLTTGDIDVVVFFGNPLVRFHRIFKKRLKSLTVFDDDFRATLKGWLGGRLFEARRRIAEALEVEEGLVAYAPRCDALAAATFQTSPFERAFVIAVDGPRVSVFKGTSEGLEMIGADRSGDDLAEQILRLAEKSAAEGLCLAGEPFRDPEVVGRIVRRSGMSVHLPTVPGNAGGALGAALWRRHGTSRPVPTPPARPYDKCDIGKAVERSGLTVESRHDGAHELAAAAAGRLAGGDAIGWFQGPAPWSDLAPSARSALIDPARPEAASTMAGKLKWNGESRRLALSVTLETVHDVFDLDLPEWAERQALAAHPLCSGRLKELEGDHAILCHAIDRKDDPLFHALLTAVGERTGLPALLNAPLALGREPLAETPADALRAYTYSDLDGLAMGEMMVGKGLTL